MVDNKPAVGDTAPAFDLGDGDGSVALADFRGQTVVLYFYPEAFTGGCTTEACGLRDEYPAITEADAVVLGVSVDDADKQRRFRDEYHLPFPVLSDPGGEVARRYGVFGIERADGSVLPQARRVTFIIDPDGRIAEVFDPVTPADHPAEVRAALERLAAG
jgi:peroxiredoxin Q/BCP